MIEAVVPFVALTAAILFVEITRPRRARFDFLFFFNMSVLVHYCLAPIHMIVGGQDYATLPNVYIDYLRGQRSESNYLFASLLIAVGYASTLVGWYARERRQVAIQVSISPPTPRTSWTVVVLCLGIGLASLALYMSQFSSPLEPIVNAMLIKMGEARDAGTLAFLRNLVPLAAVAAPLALAAFLQKAPKLRASQILVIAILILIGLVALSTQATRRSVMIYALEFYLLIANYRGRVYAGVLVPIALLSLLVVMFGDLLIVGAAFGGGWFESETAAIAASQLSALYAGIWRDLTYTFQALVAVMLEFDEFPRLFLDIPYGLLQMIPERLLPLPLPEPLENHSTLLITDVPVPLIAEFPPGYVGFMWYSGYLPGVVIGCAAYGYFGCALERSLMSGAKSNPMLMLLYTWGAFCYGYFLRDGIPSMLLIERFHWLVAGVLLILVAGVTLRRNSDPAAAGGGPATAEARP